MGYTVIFDGKRECLMCRLMKPLSEFGSYRYTTKQGKPGTRYSGRCRECDRQRNLARPRKTDRRLRRKPLPTRPGTKVCCVCHEEKELEAFYRSSRHKHGRRADCTACHRKQVTDYQKKNLPIRRQWARRAQLKRYGITPDDFDAMSAAQGGRCRICGQEKPLRVDHDHRNGEVRGLLCQNCNAALGLAKDDPQILKRMIDYLERRPSRNG